ncbi:MAG: hypothetical protein JOZ41_02705 [Chloroflexi bacterium]|nr:hypothetical protein [Chloroflexota bacterium]
METHWSFDLASFYAQVGATAKERNALRQDVVRGLKDYFEALYGYDKYGGETIFLVKQRLGAPRIYGFAMLRILHDRRVSDGTKIAVAQRALDVTRFGQDLGVPHGLFATLHFLAQRGRLSVEDLRFGLIVEAGERDPFNGFERAEMVDFFCWLVARSPLPATERAIWAHTMVTRHGDRPGATELINGLLGCDALPEGVRRELCQSWLSFRQPKLCVDLPAAGESWRSTFVAEHMGFWLTHVPSWPSHHMVRLGLVWLARVETDPLALARRYIRYRDTFADQVHAAVADIVAEHHHDFPAAAIRDLIEQGIAITGSAPTRRRFYRLGMDLLGADYLRRATSDSANSVRQWAVKQLQSQS